MSIDLENQFFGAFIAFWIARILERIMSGTSNLTYSDRIGPIATLLVAVIIIVTLLRYSLYSASNRGGARVFLHVVTVICSASVGLVLWVFTPTLFENSSLEGLILTVVLMGAILAWIIAGEINRHLSPEMKILADEYNSWE